MSEQIKQVFEKQQLHRKTMKARTVSDRLDMLKKLRGAIHIREELLFEALQADLRKSRFEAALTEIYFVYAEIDHALKNLETWAEPQKTAGTAANVLAKSYIRYEAKGTVLLLSPWNYPFQLAAGPLVSAIAAGNTVIMKPSELSSFTSGVLRELINTTFSQDEVWCVEGDAEVAKALLELPFDHIFFTGSTDVGRKVMAAASKHLATVTLELGGKSPCIVSRSAEVKRAAKKIAWGKLINSGQTCIAPDHVYVHESLVNSFIEHYKKAAKAMFFLDETRINAGSYPKMISRKHFDRQQELLDDALEKGATLAWGGESHAGSMTFFPALLQNVSGGSRMMQEEIFGPLLPVISFTDLDEVVRDINGRPTPLALYIFSRERSDTEYLLAGCSSGGACINDVLVHISNPALPFGGAGFSGMGSSHGIFGFRAFSHERAVMYQAAVDFNHLAYPPYTRKSGLLKWLRKIM
ncbi:aldehyde dehydrogenase family protein [Pedobacter sp. SYP-B3415]|uniref:aldehyde dehydrogenase family protein n=1 Tax=Pedobacter sp. SYP-B3415 TaxID=2496641 RepID=UPI00101CA7FF|nr:aldehyde dehydrogenase family protein [Pedobacter sp. SYP-B3415]